MVKENFPDEMASLPQDRLSLFNLAYQISRELLWLGFDSLVYEPLDEVLNRQIAVKIHCVHVEFERAKKQDL